MIGRWRTRLRRWRAVVSRSEWMWRLLSLPPAPDDGWREVSAVNWRSLTRDRRHTPYLRAVLDAACDGGGPVRTVDQMIERLGRPRMYSPY